MKLAEFKKLIKEAIEEEKTETTMEMMEPVDDIGNFTVVMRPKRGMKMEDMLKEVSIYDSIMKEEIIMATMDKSAARKRAKEALKEYDMAREALMKEMEEFREAKKAIEDKKKKAKETIARLR
jgi:ABC-type transporter lipoprotein component MlaA